MEKYGEIPKRWTKAWWDYFWYYYKWRVLGTLFALIVLTFTCVQCATRTKYDMVVSYAGDKYYDEASAKRMTDVLSQAITDINGDGKVNVNFQQMTIAKDGSATSGTEYNSGMLSKVALEFSAGDTYLFLFNKQEIDRLLNRNSAEQVFVPLDVWAEEIPDASLLSKKAGVSYAVNLKGNKFMTENGFYTDDLYLAIRRMRTSDEDKKEQIDAYNEAVKAANYILNY